MPSTEPNQAKPRDLLRAIYDAAILAVRGDVLVRRTLETRKRPAHVALIAIGKAAVSMANGAQAAWGSVIDRGLVITKYNHEAGAAFDWPIMSTSHPVPDQMSLDAGAALMRFIDEMPADHSVLVLISGGASALVEYLPDALALDDLKRLNQWFLASGLDIATGNACRKAISRLKGGRLAQALSPDNMPRPVLALAISDVPGDRPADIGSGPVSPWINASMPDLGRIEVPDWLSAYFEHMPDVPAPDAACFGRIEYRVIASIRDAMAAAAEAAHSMGLRVMIEDSLMTGETIETGRVIATAIRGAAPGTLHIYGGETTIRLPEHPGHGGRNQSLALSAACTLSGSAGYYVLACGTDGTDGPGVDAGALVDGATLARGAKAGFDAQAALDMADAGRFLDASGDLVRTGPTGTNVMDLVLALALDQ